MLENIESTVMRIEYWYSCFKVDFFNPLNEKLIGLYALTGIAIVIGICILVNQRKIMKILKACGKENGENAATSQKEEK